MKALSYIQENNKTIPFELGDELGYGADGQVFSLKSDYDKVLKLSVIYQNDINLNHHFDAVSKKLSFIMKLDSKHLAKVFEFNFLFLGNRNTINGPQKYLVYYTLLEKLNKFTEDEGKVLKTLCDIYNNKFGKNKPFIQSCNELQNWLLFDREKVLDFYKFLIHCPVKHNDVHRRNIMKDNLGNFKLIDFDRMTLNDVNYL